MAFPTSPSDGDFYNENGVTWLYVSPPGVWTKAGGTPITIDESDPVFSASAAASYTEAPIDGTPYSRQDAGWVAAASAVNSIDDIGDVTITTAANGEVLQYNGAAWVNATAPAGYTDADVDTHLNTGTAGAGEVLSWTGSDYDWITAGGGSLWDDQTTFYRSSVPVVIGSATETPDDLNGNYTGITVAGAAGGAINFTNGTTLQGRIFGNTGNTLTVRPGASGKFEVTDTNGIDRFRIDGTTGQVRIGWTNDSPYTLPGKDGTANQVLTTNGSGTASWQDAGGGGGFDPTANKIVLGTHDADPDAGATTSIAIGSSQFWYAGNTGIMIGWDTQNNGTNNIVIGNSTKLQGSNTNAVCIGNNAGNGLASLNSSVMIGHNAGNGSLNVNTNAIVINASGSNTGVAGAGGVVLQTTKAKMEYSDANGWQFGADIGGTPSTATISPDTGVYVFPNLPTSDPVNAGQLWNDAGTLKVSAG